MSETTLKPDELIARIRAGGPDTQAPAWQLAGPVGAPAIAPLVALLEGKEFEPARHARRALERVVRHAGRPGANSEARAVESALVACLNPRPGPATTRVIAWLLSELPDDNSVPELARLLNDPDVRDDARCSLARIPGAKATAALKGAIQTAPEEFRFALAESLRARGVAVEGYPSRKLVPLRKIPGSEKA